ncbi:IS701 family transposase [Saccharopolyspora phatthalungensis]|uniref:Transposase IS701-like DDE domain-containing protein n=1 Tax=Saccharopolyspora phatthalungensis TaxID=664693 RepID=A0A840Q2S1_9PSEU|nr:transposase [Saccharopolyspora phatthalungensis]MBB5154230.1 hypothetical protein [Saccharopolyspora phatthalungensis]MBB5154376.1 hypothetical protein [Saccharopolyspora phatthalungensis]MBB5157501.1 hypothetical protein [Saccharopolyspora phatthalungensis]
MTLPASLAVVVEAFRGCFTAPSFQTFTMLVAGLITQTGRGTVCGMLTAAGMAGRRHHDWAHRFFAEARWSADRLGLTLAALLVDRLLDTDAVIEIAVDDTLFRRSGRKIHAAAWHHDPTSPSPVKTTGWGHCWVVAGLVLHPSWSRRPVCLPVLARLWRPGGTPKPQQARELIELLAARLPGRRFHVVADAFYGTRHWRGLPAHLSLTTRPRSNAALHEIHEPLPGVVGRPRYKGPKTTLAEIAEHQHWRTVTVTRYGRTETTRLLEHRCLWPHILLRQHARVILVHDGRPRRDGRAWDLALITTDLDTPAEQIIERYAARWAIEVTFHQAKHDLGAGQARNRTPHAVERTVPFGLVCYSLVYLWYALAGHDPTDVTDRRRTAPWYTTKTEPSYQDMLIKLRRVLIAEQFRPTPPRPPTPQETLQVHHAWATATA